MSDVKLLRKVLVFDSAAQSKKEFQSSATTWGDLKRELSSHGISTSNCKFIEGSTKLTLEQDQALLPMKDFVTFKMPVSTKSAAAPTFTSAQYKEEIKRHISNDSSASKFFAGYSSMKVDELAAIIKKYEAKLKKDQAKAEKVVAKPVAKAAAKPVAKAKEAAPKAKPVAKKVETVKPTKPTSTVKKAVGKVVESVKKAVAKKPIKQVETAEWMTLLQKAAELAPPAIAENINYIIAKELEVPVITTDISALAAIARQLK